jgi:tRNA threonylcarbamoyladenosine biosynthesis protein TsaB
MNAAVWVLGFDTCGTLGTAALATLDQESGSLKCVQQIELAAKTSAAQLVPAVSSLLQDAGIGLAALQAMVVVHGPGSFTGVRAGVATAQGLAQASSVPLVAMSRLAMLASLSSEEPACLALLEAGRGEYYAGHYREGSCEREWLASQEEVVTAVESGLVLVAAEASVEARIASLSPRMVGPLDAWAALQAARPRLIAAAWDDLRTLDAHYVRRSDAELFARTPAQRA